MLQYATQTVDANAATCWCMSQKLLIQMLQHTAACHTLRVTHTVPVPVGQPAITHGNLYPYKSVPVPMGTGMGMGWTPKPAGLPVSLPIHVCTNTK